MKQYGRFSPEAGAPYVMPAHFGKVTRGWDGKVAKYGQLTNLSVLFQTEHDAIAELLPTPFVVPEEPVVTVSYVRCRDVDFLAGGGYNLVSVSVGTRFEGERDSAAGGFPLVMWENHFLPILLGREVLGVAKLLADIPDYTQQDRTAEFAVSEQGTPLIQGQLRGLQPLAQDQLDRVGGAEQDQAMLGWKHIPSCDLRSAALSQATVLPAKVQVREAWLGTGEVSFNKVDWHDAPIAAHIVNALHELPIKAWLGAVLAHGSQQLLIHKQRELQ